MSDLLAVEGAFTVTAPLAASEARPCARLASNGMELQPIQAEAAATQPAGLQT
ncbi:MAG: hypothetical protein U5L08_00770 [Xanthomonadales bacterium]|nr:hypothetical protein [Xanthomonadales bacterium]